MTYRIDEDPLAEVRSARAEILHLAEPQDPCVQLSLSLLGAPTTADLLSQRKPLGDVLTERAEDLAELAAHTRQEWAQQIQTRIKNWAGRKRPYTFEREMEIAGRLGAWVMIPEDPDWPEQLHDLGADEPFALWGRGDRTLLQHLSLQGSVAVVGSRDTTSYGNSATTHLAGDLAAQGYTIVSGGAFGIDAVAHRSALATAAGPLPTVALMAGGVDRPYPKHNEQLLSEVIQRGLLLSEVPLSYQPTRWRFLQRNRLIAALASVTVVVEARWRSGALNTAHHALEIGREVRVVPGQIFSPNSEGCHRLLRDRLAQITTSASDIMESLNQHLQPEQEHLFESPETSETVQLSEAEQRIWDALPLRNFAATEHLGVMAGVEGRNLLLGLSQLAQKGLAEQTAQGWRKSKAYKKAT